MTARDRIYIGTAGWSIPRASAHRFDANGTHLERYARRFRCVEINSSFYRAHTPATYARWRASTPSAFRFAVKVPRAITHELRLVDTQSVFDEFLEQTSRLEEKRGALLVQLPPSLAFDRDVAGRFFEGVRAVYEAVVVCEPRHATWFSAEAAALLDTYRIARVLADPPPVPEAQVTPGAMGLVYFRLHGSPRMYWSKYSSDYLETLAETIATCSLQGDVWCVFDNTATGAAIENADELSCRL